MNITLIPQDRSWTGLSLAYDIEDNYFFNPNIRFSVFDFSGRYSDYTGSNQFSREEKNPEDFLTYHQFGIVKKDALPIISNFNLCQFVSICEFIQGYYPDSHVFLILSPAQKQFWDQGRYDGPVPKHITVLEHNKIVDDCIMHHLNLVKRLVED